MAILPINGSSGPKFKTSTGKVPALVSRSSVKATTQESTSGGFWSNLGKSLLTGVARGAGASVAELFGRAKASYDAAPVGSFTKTAGGLIGSMTSANPVLLSLKGALTGINKISPDKNLGLFEGMPVRKALTPFESGKEFAGTFSEAALDTVTLGLAPGSYQLGKEILTGGLKAVSKKSAAALAKTLLADATIGVGYGEATTLQNKEAEMKDYLKAGLYGGTAGVLIPPVFGGATSFATKGARKIGRAIGTSLDQTAGELETFSSRYLREADKVFQQNTEELRGFKPVGDIKAPTFRERAAGSIAKGIRSTQKLPEKIEYFVFNEFQPYGKIKKIAESLGVDMPNLERMARLSTDQALYKANKKFEDITNSFTLNIPKGREDLVPKAMEYHKLLAAVSEFQMNGSVDKTRFKKGIEDLAESLRGFVKENAKDLNTIKKVVNDSDVRLKQVLEELKLSGNISERDYQNIIQRKFYVPGGVETEIDPVTKLFTEGDEERPQFLSSSSSAKSVSLKRAKGTERQRSGTENYFSDVLEYLVSVYKKAEKQKVVQGLLDGVRENPEAFGVKFIGEGRATKKLDIPKGYQELVLKDRGIETRVQIPDDLAFVIKGEYPGALQWFFNLSKHSIFKPFSSYATYMRKNLVQLNPLFTLFRNPVRDAQNAYTIAGTTAFDLMRAMKEQMLGKFDLTNKEMQELARQHGAFMGRMLDGGMTPGETSIRLLNEKGILGDSIVKAATGKSPKTFKPVQLYKDVADGLEEMTRLATFKKYLKEGYKPQDAAEMARTASTDFGKYGALTKVLAGVIPFLNPQVQGFFNVANLLDKNPVEFYRRAFRVAGTLVPALHAWNSQFESNENIPWYDRKRGWNIIYAEMPITLPDGSRTMMPKYVTIPVGEALAPVKVGLEFFLMDKKTQEIVGYDRLMQDMAKSFLPLNAIPTLPLVQTGYELAANYSFFRDAQIVPDSIYTKKGWKKIDELNQEDQFDATSSDVSIILGKVLGWSPKKIDYVIKQGLAGTVIDMLDIPISIKRKDELVEEKGEVKDETDLPFVKGILKSTQYGNFWLEKENEEKKVREENSRILNE